MRLIDADLLKQNMEKYVCDLLMEETDLYEMPLREIDDAPTVTPSEIQAMMNDYLVYKNEPERPHAQWITDTDYESYKGYFEAYKCSNCGYGIHWRDYYEYKYKYCPSCGAKMNK